MIAHLNLDDRLSILRVGDPFRSWNSLDDQRVCVLGGRKFKGRQVDIRRLPGGKFRLCCPTLGCMATPDQWRNRAVTDPFEPGSTFKAILAASALEDGVVKPTDRFYGEQGG